MANKKTDYDVNIGGSAAGLKRATDEGIKALGRFRGDAQKVAKQILDPFQAVRTAVGGLVAAFSFKTVIANVIEAERTQRLLEQRIKSTGREAEFSARSLSEMASQLEEVTTFGDETIITAQSLMLTFGKIGRDVFPRALAAAMDLSEGLGTDLQSAVLALGKALDNPIEGLAGLQRIGVRFNAEQKRMIEGMVRAGQVSQAQALILAELEKRFGGTARAAAETFGGALAQLKNAADNLVEGDGEGLAGATQAVKDLTEQLRDPKTKEGFAVVTGGLVTMTGWLAQAVTELGRFGQWLGFVAAKASGSVMPLDDLKQQLQDVDAALRNSLLFKPTKFLFTDDAELQRLKKQLENQISILEGVPAPGPKKAYPDALGGAADIFDRAAARTDGTPKSSQQQAEAAKAAGILLRGELERRRQALDQALEDELVSFAAYYQRRAAIERDAIDQQLREQRAALAALDEEIAGAEATGEDSDKLGGQRAQAIAQITELERQRGHVAVQAAREQAQAEKDLADQLADVRGQLLDLSGQAGEGRRAELERQYREFLARLVAEGDAAGQELVRRLINVEVARAELSELEAEISRVMAGAQASESSVANQREAGLLTGREAAQRIVELHLETAAALDALIPRYEKLAAASGDPQAVIRIQELRNQVSELGVTTSAVAKQIEDDLEAGFANAFADVLLGTESFGGALANLWKEIIGSLTRTFADEMADMLITYLRNLSIAQAFGTAGNLGFGTALSTPIEHTGGVVGEGGTQRRVPASVFLGVPRMHTGGIAGLAPDEVPAILQKGEEVLTRKDPRHRANGGTAAPQVNVTIVTQDAGSFQRSKSQIAAEFATMARRSLARDR